MDARIFIEILIGVDLLAMGWVLGLKASSTRKPKGRPSGE